MRRHLLPLAAIAWLLGCWIGTAGTSVAAATIFAVVGAVAILQAGGYARAMAVFVTITALGAAWGVLAARPPGAVVLADHPLGMTGPWRTRGVMLTTPQPVGGGWQTDLSVTLVHIDGRWRALPFVVRTTVYDQVTTPQWLAGDRFETFLSLRADRSPANPLVGRRPPLRASGVDVRATLKSFRQLRRRPRAIGWPPAAVARLRPSIRVAAERLFGEHAGLVEALILGERGRIDQPTARLFARTGLVHLLAISGLHVGVAIAALFAVLRVAGISPARAAAGCFVTLPLIYAVVVPRSSVARACLMAAFVLGSMAIGRRSSAIRTLAAATLTMAVADPWVVRDIGFQLSTGATAALLSAGVGRPSSPLYRAATAAVSPVVVQLAVAPILAATVYRIPTAAIVANLAAVPLLSVALPLIIAALAADAMAATALVTILVTASNHALAALVVVASSTDALASAVAIAAAQVPSIFVLSSAALLAAAGFAAAHRRPPAPAIGLAPLLAVLMAALPVFSRAAVDHPLEPSPVRFVALDIGQGDALLVEFSGGGAFLMDAGGSPWSSFDTGASIIAPALRARGRNRLDAVAVSHLHADHVGGVNGLLAELPAREIWVPSYPPTLPAAALLAANSAGAPILTVSRGHQRRYPPCTLIALHPSDRWLVAGGTAVSNDNSLVLSLECGRRRLLLTGDIESNAEAALLPSLAPRAGTILKVAHHGSKTSSDGDFLDATAPRHAVISAGWRNRFGHPDSEVLARYRKLGIAVYRTDRDGAVTVEMGDRIRVRGERWTSGRGRHRRGGWLP